MLGPLMVRALGLAQNLKGRPGLPARKRERMAFPDRDIAAMDTGLLTAVWAIEGGMASFHPVPC